MEATSYIMYSEDEPAHKSAIIVSGLTGFPLFVPSEQNCVLFKEDAISTQQKKKNNNSRQPWGKWHQVLMKHCCKKKKKKTWQDCFYTY